MLSNKEIIEIKKEIQKLMDNAAEYAKDSKFPEEDTYQNWVYAN